MSSLVVFFVGIGIGIGICLIFSASLVVLTTPNPLVVPDRVKVRATGRVGNISRVRSDGMVQVTFDDNFSHYYFPDQLRRA